MDPISTQERAKYERMWACDQYRDDHVSAHAAAALERCRPAAADSLIDFGAGAGYASAHFIDAGMRVLAIDIASNAMDRRLTPRVPRLIGSLWDLPVTLTADWGFCCDVMEHVPPERVDDVLAVIRESTRRSTYFCISLRPDGCGRLIDATLHLTVRPWEWWRARVGRRWASVEVLDHEPGERVVFIAHGRGPAGAPDRE
jgi:hypothetical protein